MMFSMSTPRSFDNFVKRRCHRRILNKSNKMYTSISQQIRQWGATQLPASGVQASTIIYTIIHAQFSFKMTSRSSREFPSSPTPSQRRNLNSISIYATLKVVGTWYNMMSVASLVSVPYSNDCY
jgi:hypothetical protein